MRPTDKEELFSAKLRELERRQEETVLRLHLFQRADHAQVRQGLKQLRQEFPLLLPSLPAAPVR